ncbi:MAG: hypothetical protein HZA24_05730 [Nitrospirae bacterium]|nr:hypothetical protein [Nitrospirota bacterium]
MTVLSDGDLQITLPDGVAGRKFDDDASHGLSHCMKRVDFIVDLIDKILFVEFKDPDNPAARPKDRRCFMEKFGSGTLDNELKKKYRDSFLYEWASGRASKPIYYLVLIGASALSAAELLARTDALKRQIPVVGPGNRSWVKPFIAGCAVMNIDAWNRELPHYPVSRISP